MQMFGIGVLEILVVLLLTIIVVGPDRMPKVAADLARWIRQGRAYARYLMGDFNAVIGELQKEANVSEEDWKEISSVVSRNTGELGKELERAAKDAEEAGDLALAKANEPVASSTNGNGSTGTAAAKTAEAEAEPGEAAVEDAEASEDGGADAEEKPWYEPEKTTRASRRRRSSE
jgi:sec-independent protein translocase protein TatB